MCNSTSFKRTLSLWCPPKNRVRLFYPSQWTCNTEKCHFEKQVRTNKNVRFAEEPTVGAVATSEFVSKTNQAWTFVATCFDLTEESRNKTFEGEKELLVLCNYFNDEEGFPVLNGKSNETVPFELFAEQGMNITWNSGKTSPSVSTLRLSSFCRLTSRPSNSSTFESDDTDTDSQNPFLEDGNDLEDAFHGRLTCSNTEKTSRSRRSSAADKKDESCSETSSEDFWSGVEF